MKFSYERIDGHHGRLFLNGKMIGWVYFYWSGHHYGYRLSINPHKLSQRFENLKNMYSEIERKFK